MKSLVSIIIPTYNRASLLGETLESVLRQTYRNWECLVIDDGSEDKTLELVKFYSNKDNRITYYNRPQKMPKGASSCRNYGLEKSKGVFVQFLDSDDLISQEKLSSQVELLEENPYNSIATCKWGTFNSQIEDAELHENLSAYKNFEDPLDFINAMGKAICYFPPHSYLIRKDIILKAGYWNEYLSLNDDGEFVMRVIVNSNKICYSKDSIAFYRLPGSNNLSAFDDERKVRDAIYSWKLIENYLKIRFKQEEFDFIKRAKRDFFQHAKVYPGLIKENKSFFEEELKRDTSWVKRLLNF